MAKKRNENLRERFAQEMASGADQVTAYRRTHPKSRAKYGSVVAMAAKMAAEAGVKDAVEKIQEETRREWGFLRDKLIEYLWSDVETAHAEGPLDTKMNQVNALTRILGFDHQTIEVKSTGISGETLQEKREWLAQLRQKHLRK